ncbi:MAG: hypothetical protein ACRDVG_13680 [Jatrophihabitantaceae bacterium]
MYAAITADGETRFALAQRVLSDAVQRHFGARLDRSELQALHETVAKLMQRIGALPR